MSDKLYWSNEAVDKWESGNFLTLVLIPNKWWSIKAWKYGASVRWAMLQGLRGEQ